jgi:hypothetical protein
VHTEINPNFVTANLRASNALGNAQRTLAGAKAMLNKADYNVLRNSILDGNVTRFERSQAIEIRNRMASTGNLGAAQWVGMFINATKTMNVTRRERDNTPREIWVKGPNDFQSTVNDFADTGAVLNRRYLGNDAQLRAQLELLNQALGRGGARTWDGYRIPPSDQISNRFNYWQTR